MNMSMNYLLLMTIIERFQEHQHYLCHMILGEAFLVRLPGCYSVEQIVVGH